MDRKILQADICYNVKTFDYPVINNMYIMRVAARSDRILNNKLGEVGRDAQCRLGRRLKRRSARKKRFNEGDENALEVGPR